MATRSTKKKAAQASTRAQGDAPVAASKGKRRGSGGGNGKGKAELSLTEAMARVLAKDLVPDLTARARQPSVEAALRAAWDAERTVGRTSASFAEWTENTVEQVGAAWILSCLFVRVLEDRGFLSRHRIAGEAAMDSQHQFFELVPALTERDYLLTVFHELSTVPGAVDVLGRAHNPAWKLSPSNDAVRALLAVVRAVNDDGMLRYQFDRVSQPTTHFLGNLYEEVSESVRNRYALLQTPPFVERFILDGTLEPAIAEFGLAEVRLIDPTCGSGHFVLGAFERLCDHWQRTSPGMAVREVANRALAQVHGVDLNPYAVAIARFRLTLAYLERAGFARLAEAPRIETNLVVADSLLHRTGQVRMGEHAPDVRWGDAHLFDLDEPERARLILDRGYHAVVGNPPYITCRDPVLREKYRAAYASAAGKYSLAAPFTERFFQLAVDRGFVGLINANSFMKREFGKALIEKVLPLYDLAEVIDTSGAYIPGHGTPTVILFGRKQRGISEHVPVVMGKRGEHAPPDVPEHGQVWTGIVTHHREIGFENDFISVGFVSRSVLAVHPWSLGGGGAADLKQTIEDRCAMRLSMIAKSIGVGGMSNADDVFLGDIGSWRRAGLDDSWHRPLVVGEELRDWSHKTAVRVFFPYDRELRLRGLDRSALKALWPYRTVLGARAVFGGGTYASVGRPWYEWHQLTTERYKTPLTIAYAEVATHNHFVLDRGGSVFKQTAPIIKLGDDAAEADWLALVAYLNSSTACFWLKQVSHSKGAGGIGGGLHTESWSHRRAFDSSKVSKLPVPVLSGDLREIGVRLDALGRAYASASYESEIERWLGGTGPEPLRDVLADLQRRRSSLRRALIAGSEELDWLVYELLALTAREDNTRFPGWEEYGLGNGDRAFEIAWSRRLAGGDAPPTDWFSRHGAAQAVDVGGLPAALKVVTQRRMAVTADNAHVRLIEQPEYKRRWSAVREQDAVHAAARNALLERIERLLAQRPVSIAEILHAIDRDARLAQVADCIADARSELRGPILQHAVPFLAQQRFRKSGFVKHLEWRACWSKQSAVDRGHAGEPPELPPYYEVDDYVSNDLWQLRGKLDVPRERFVSYPALERDEDKSPLIGWAGWDHLERAHALAELFQQRKDIDGWPAARLQPILAGILELVPWLKQWHNEPTDGAVEGMGDAYEGFLKEKSRELGLTLDDLRDWRPETKMRRSARTTENAKAAAEPDAQAPVASERRRKLRKEKAPL